MHQHETRDNPEYTAQAIMDAIAGKMTGKRPAGLAGELAGRSILDMGADWLASHGVSTRGMNRAQIADAMFSTRSAGGPGSYFGARDGGGMLTTSDFPNLLSGGINHVMLARYQIGACAIKTVSALHNLPDFRPRTLVRVSASGLLPKVGEADEVTHASRQDDGQKISLGTYAKMLTYSRQAMVNDDLGGLADQANSFADSSNNTEGTLFAALLNANGGSGPTLSDGQPMFTTARGNKAAVGGALTIATLDIARQAIRNTTDFDGKTPLSLTPKYLLVSPANETAAEQLLTSILATQVSNVNPFAGKLELLVDARLTGNAWRLFADPSQAPVMAHGYLEGATGPQIAMRQGWDRLGMEWRVTLDFGCAAAGWRGAYLNPGQ